MDFEIRLRKNGGFEIEGERCAGGNCDGGVGRDGSALVPGLPEGGDGRKGDGRKLFGGAEEKFRQGRGNKDERDAVEEKREDEVGKTVGVRERDAGEVWSGGRELHRGNDVGSVGGELRAGEGDAFGSAAGGGGEFEMGDIRRWSWKLWRCLRNLQMAGDCA